MPLELKAEQAITTLSLVGRCTIDDVLKIAQELRDSLARSPSLKLDLSRNESVDTATVQLIHSAAQSAESFLSAQDPSYLAIQSRWSLSSNS